MSAEKKMKAILVTAPGGVENLVMGTWEKPVPGKTEILVKVAAAALNRADISQRLGKYPPPAGASPILGLEMSGEVVGLGEESARWVKGDKVFGLIPGGGYAEYAVIDQRMAMKVPEGMSMAEAASVPEVFLTAYQALFWHAHVKPGETILIHAGASGVGVAATQIARAVGATVIVTASAGKLQRCLDLGASVAIDYAKGPFQPPVMHATNNQGVDTILDFIGGPYFQQNMDSLKPDGNLVILSTLGGGTVEKVDLRQILLKRFAIIGSTLRARTRDYQIALTEDFWRFALPFFEKKALIPIVDTVFDWKDVAKAHQRMEQNLNTGKIVLSVG
jgi:tumor protein p53-inducible protein 3